MSTIIYPSPIVGPIHSRRLGVSLGINLMPDDGKVCTFDCLYCECGFNADHRAHRPRPTRGDVATALESKLQTMQTEGTRPDVLTFSGNGEPTGHPDFSGIVDDVLRLRDHYFPSAKVSVLSNATFAHLPQVHEALMRVDNNILKLDTVSPSYIQTVDRPVSPQYDVHRIIDTMRSFDGHVIVQTIFMHGRAMDGTAVDNVGEEYVAPWLSALEYIGPQQVMIYTIDSETPDPYLAKATPEELDAIGRRVEALGIDCTVAY